MTQALSVLEKAQQFQAVANQLREEDAAQVEATRVLARIDDTSALLGALQQAVTMARRLNRRAGARIDVGAARNGCDQFARVTAAGLPPNSVFASAQQAIQKATEQINRQVAAEWKAWTTDQIAVLPQLRLTMLAAGEQATCRKRLEELQRLARKAAPSPTDVDVFATSYDLLTEALDSVGDPAPEVVALLQRLDLKPAMRLQDISDDEIALLRTAGVAGQIELHRRDV